MPSSRRHTAAIGRALFASTTKSGATFGACSTKSSKAAEAPISAGEVDATVGVDSGRNRDRGVRIRHIEYIRVELELTEWSI